MKKVLILLTLSIFCILSVSAQDVEKMPSVTVTGAIKVEAQVTVVFLLN